MPGPWFEGRTALVTGGSAGIGKEIARELAAGGARVIIVSRDRARAEAVIRGLAGHVELLSGDLSIAAEQDRIVAEVGRRWPDLSILVNNAGVQVNLPEIGIGDDGRMRDLRGEVGVNLVAPITLSLGLMPVLALQPAAVIVNISSGLAITPKRTAPVYCATKAALRSFTAALRYRCEDAAPTIRVVDVVMAYVDTDMTRGRPGAKMTPVEAARAVVTALGRGQREIWVGNTRLLSAIHRLSPALAVKIMRNA